MISLRSLITLFIAFLLIGCAADPIPATDAPTEPPSEESAATDAPTEAPTEAVPFTLTSTSYAENAEIPLRYVYAQGSQCAGENYSPQLAWTGTPAGTQSFAITMIDQNFVHWLQFNIPAETTELAETIGGPEIGVKAINGFGEFGYGGPCPPSGTHTYVITLYALDTMLDVSPTSTRRVVENAMEGHILGQVEWIGVHTPE
jgi:Raf kinase inhibitor-like YbhB/YbcL family protein